MILNFATIIGILGMILLLIAFILDLFDLDKINQETVTYNLLNILGSGLLMYYAYTLNSLPFIILEIVWTAFAVYKLKFVLAKKLRN